MATSKKRKSKQGAKKKVGAAVRWVSPSPDQIITFSDDEISKLAVAHAAQERAFETIRDDVINANPFKGEPPEAVFERALSGHEYSVGKLLEMAERYTLLLNELAAKRPELIVPVAKGRGVWPVLANNENSLRKKQSDLFASIGLGAELDVSSEIERMFRVKTLAQQHAWLLVRIIRSFRIASRAMRSTVHDLKVEGNDREACLIHFGWATFQLELSKHIPEIPFEGIKLTVDLLSQCEKLEPLTSKPSVAEKWWHVAREILMLNTDGHPEQYPHLQKIGRSGAKKNQGFSEKSQQTNIRSKIFGELRKAFTSFGKLPKKLRKQDG